MRAGGPTARWLRRGRRAPVRGCRAVVTLCLLALVACGSGEDDGDRAASRGADGPGAAPGGPTEPVAADLTITARLGDEAEERRLTITCPPERPSDRLWPGGATHERACASLADPSVLESLRPPPADQVCAEVYGGPEVATITGTVGADPVDARVDRTDACGIARWDALAPLLPPLGR